ncbi:MAG TPA: DUF3048 domain-containing protein [Acidimicrobiales bacterium]|nr:DUF3048 domain-containing protein [Acidimicrobiales bacterium]
MSFNRYAAAKKTRVTLYRFFCILAALILFGSSCANSVDSPETTPVQAESNSVVPSATPIPPATPTPIPSPTPTPSLTPIPTPTPTNFEKGEIEGITRSPFNGTAVTEESLTRRVLAIKVDNHLDARPQSGIDLADMIVEIWVEGITRYLAVFQSSDSDFVGPMRSMRPTDFSIQNAWSSTFINSGGQEWIQTIGNNSTVRWFEEPPGSFRISGRFRPHNLYGDTSALRTLDTRGDYGASLDPLWNFGDMDEESTSADEIKLSYWFDYTTSWYWNADKKVYEKSTTGQPHYYLDAENVAHRISAETLIMLEMLFFLTCYGCESGTTVPVAETVGSGTAWVFHGGKMQKGTWSRSSDREWFELTAEDGSQMLVPPGKLWMTLARTNNVIPQ